MDCTYIELRCRSAFTFLDGASLPEELVEQAAALGYLALAVADRDGVYAAPRVYHAARRLAEAAGCDRQAPATWPIRPLLGAELSLADGTRLLVLVETQTGYRKLTRLLTAARMDAASPAGGKVTPAISYALLAAHLGNPGEQGLIALTGGLEGAVGRALAQGDRAGARQALDTLCELFGPHHLYVELQRHYDADEEARNRELLGLARYAHLPIVATNDVRYARSEDHRLYDILCCVQHKTTIDQIGRRLEPTGERYLKAPAAMAALFAELPAALAATRTIAQRCQFTLAQLGYAFPDYPSAPETPQEHLERLTWEHAPARFCPTSGHVFGADAAAPKKGMGLFCQAQARPCLGDPWPTRARPQRVCSTRPHAASSSTSSTSSASSVWPAIS